jgi:hypothetical protein
LSSGQFISKFGFAGLKVFATNLMKWQKMIHVINASNIGGDDVCIKLVRSPVLMPRILGS